MTSLAPALGRVLCATDLSEFGNRAVPFAFAVAAPGGRVTLTTVLETPGLPSPLLPRYGVKRASEEELDARERDASARIEALGRGAAGTRDVAYEVRVARAPRVADAILAEAERIDASAICLATHSRSGLVQLMLGSAAQEVLQRAGRPIVLIPSPVAG